MSDAEPYETTTAARLAVSAAPVEWLVEGLLLRGGAAILGGAPKTGKTFFALDICVAVASATPCAGRFAVEDAGPVLLLCAEDPPGVLVGRLSALARARAALLDQLPIDVIVEPSVRLPAGLDRLAATVDRRRPSLLLLDPLIRLHRADENSAGEMSEILDGIRHLARTSRTSILLVHHARKAPAGASSGTALRGSSDLAAFGDANLYLRRADGALELRVEHRACASPDPLRLRLVAEEGAAPSARFEAVHATAASSAPDPRADRIVALIAAAAAPLTAAALREQLGVRNQIVADALRALAAAGRIRRAGRDGWALAPSAT